MNWKSIAVFSVILLSIQSLLFAQTTQPPQADPRLYTIANAASPQRLEADIRKLVGFGTRNTFSDTVSTTRGIGAARRWIKSEFEKISAACNSCLEIKTQSEFLKGGSNPRITQDVTVVNILAIQRGSRYPNRYVIMSGDIDSRVSNASDATKDSPGANDNGTGMAGAIEAARVLSKYKFPVSIIYVGLSGEEQGLWGGQHMAKVAKAEGWDIVGVLNNDMIGNIEGINGEIENTTFRVFSEPTPPIEDERERTWRRVYGGEVDGPSRQLARYIDRMTEQYCTNLDAIMIYRLDRFGRGGHHKPFNDVGFPGVRIMETHEQYQRQHQDLRTEDGIKYGDVIEGVNFPYAAKLTGVNMMVMAALASAPPEPKNVQIGGIVLPSTRLKWDAVADPDLIGYKLYWRETTAAQWQHSRFVDKSVTDFTLENIIIDNYLFGVASVGKDGNESLIVYPTTLIARR
ncbi:M28 family peptidase [Haliscomenobacter hydrossis]|uniref:Peptidase M28 n=1 Tax=Haliscomenobacter hydrossis (strain ATCC 27775 / DSM 1100 / LMG 10767 / O) TaxID=760192 RepID=F4L2N7_HALH1|nr:M28 family metallopeptidase [Haliscomenobacter hydrossis]AEE48601.1 peptidase M28 [Haliscomenobacter hydrossis DSM 1100]